MIRNAHAKINWALNITGRREDGYHLLDMIMQKVALHDTLHFENTQQLSLTIDGNDQLSCGEDNLIICAARALDPNGKHGARIRLEKQIPSGAGLGGGSADAAATLLALNELWQLSLPMETLSKIALRLGADVPYCLLNGAARIGGIGECITSLPCAKSYSLIIAKPDQSLPTKDVYQAYHRFEETHPDIDSMQDMLSSGTVSNKSNTVFNSLYPPAAVLAPDVSVIKQAFASSGAIFTEMTGSGSAVFAVYTSKEEADLAFSLLQPQFPFCIRTETLL